MSTRSISPKGKISLAAVRMFPQETSVADAVCRYGPSCEKVVSKHPQVFGNYEIKIIFPLNMPRATRRAFPIVLLIEYKKARRQSSASLSVGGFSVKQRGKRGV